MGRGIEMSVKVLEIMMGSNFIKFSIDGIISAASIRMAIEEVCRMHNLDRDAFTTEVRGNDVYLCNKNKACDNSEGILSEPTKIEPAMDFVIDMVHNIDELAELQKELTKWVRGKLRKDKLIQELNDVYIAIENIEKWIDKL
jgi:hypothetical protein